MLPTSMARATRNPLVNFLGQSRRCETVRRIVGLLDHLWRAFLSRDASEDGTRKRGYIPSSVLNLRMLLVQRFLLGRSSCVVVTR